MQEDIWDIQVFVTGRLDCAVVVALLPRVKLLALFFTIDGQSSLHIAQENNASTGKWTYSARSSTVVGFSVQAPWHIDGII